MTTVTLESIQAEQTRVNHLIESFLRQQAGTTYGIPEATIELAPGERYVGIVLGEDGEPHHHLILLCGEEEQLTHPEATAWAQSIGGELPARREQALLFANLHAFQPEAYWSGETYDEDSSYAWYQTFGHGYQSCILKSGRLRAVAVRRLVIE